MTFPYVFESNFELGDNSEWDSETDTSAQLDFPHYSELAAIPGFEMPYQGAYCARLALTGDTTDAILTEGDIDVAAEATRWFRFYVYFSNDFDATANDTVNLFELQAAGGTVEVAFGFRYVATTDVINLGIGETAPTSFSSEAIVKGKWYCVELKVVLDAGGGNDGTIDLYVTPGGAHTSSSAVAATQVASLDQGAVIQGVLGVQDHLATTTGTILFDCFAMDDTRVYPYRRRWDTSLLLTKSGHVFVGGGCITDIQLNAGAATDNLLLAYDTDDGDTSSIANSKFVLRNTANNEIVSKVPEKPTHFRHGAYIALSGTNPSALVHFCHARAFGSVASIRSHGMSRTRT